MTARRRSWEVTGLGDALATARTLREAWPVEVTGWAEPAASLIAEAETRRGEPWPWPSARAYARFWRDGDRVEYQDAVFARQRRLTTAVVAALVSEDDDWLDEVADGVLALCEQSTWCWPAHDESWSLFGRLTPQVEAPTLDLGAGEVASQLAWIDAVLGERLERRYPGLGARVRLEYTRRVAEPLLARDDWWWLVPERVNNWTAWILGNVVTGALQLSDGEQREAQLRVAVEGLDLFLRTIPLDGAVDEGYHYWWAGVGRALDAIEVLERATDGVIGGDGVDGLADLVGFPVAMHLSADWVISHSDGPARAGEKPWRLLHRWGRATSDDAAVAFAGQHREDGVTDASQSLGRVLTALLDPVWVGETAGGGETTVAPDVWLPSVQVRVVRPAEPDGLTLVIKGGHNDESHNHHDVGVVSIAAAGRPIAVDPGREEYTAQTFSPQRYELWHTGSGWHNVPELDGEEQREGREHAARAAELINGDRRGLGLDLAAAYPAGTVEVAMREATVEQDGSVVVVDRWRFATAGSGVVHWVVAGEPVATRPGELRIAVPDAPAVLVSWEGAAEEAVVEVRELSDTWMVGSWGSRLWRITLATESAEPEVVVTTRWRVEPSG